MLNYEKFSELLTWGPSRYSDAGVSYVLVEENGQEVFYAEWELVGVDVGEDGSPTQKGYEQIEEQDDYHLELAYEAYKSGESEYIGKVGWGGFRPGAGRPATGRRKRNLYVTDEEYERLKEYLERIRNGAPGFPRARA